MIAFLLSRAIRSDRLQNYLDDQTALLVQSIQPLVHMIRTTSISNPADEQQVSDYIQDISRAVQDTASRTQEAVRELANPALKKHAIPVIEILEDCKIGRAHV